jgi:hypothetical protein
MGLNIEKEVAQMQRMTIRELQEKFIEVCGEQPRTHNRQWMIKRLAWKLQAREYGGLSEQALRRAAEIADACDLSDLRLTAPRSLELSESIAPTTLPPSVDSRLPMAGTLLTRRYKGATIQVKVLNGGFEFEGERFKSLSAVAHRVTGSRWNGYLFFGLTKKEVVA